MRRILLLLLPLLAACATAQRDAVPAGDIDRFVTETVRQIPEAPSIGMAVVRDGKTVYLRDAQTGYYIGSTTKAYTGLACAIFAAQGRLDLDAPITKYLPEVRMTAPLDAGQITLRKLLTHTAALDNDPIVTRTAFTGEHTPALLLSLLNSSKPGQPGFHYTNLGYVIASMIIERVTGEPWQQVLDETVFTPLGMNHTSAYMSEAARWTLTEPHMMNPAGGMDVLAFRKNDKMMHAAGGIVTTPADLAIWLNANIARSGGGIPSAAFEEAQKTQTPTETGRGELQSRGYGFGWFTGDYKGETALFHQGGFPGWQSAFTFLPDRKIGVGVMTNASGPGALQTLQIVTSYALDRLLEKPDAGSAAATRVARLKEDIAKGRAAFQADIEKRAKRTWMLKHANDAYAGRYDSPTLGTLVIRQEGDRLVASLGPNLRAPLEAFTEPETARVELIPGSGEVLRFTFDGGARPVSVKWDDEEFRRVD